MVTTVLDLILINIYIVIDILIVFSLKMLLTKALKLQMHVKKKNAKVFYT